MCILTVKLTRNIGRKRKGDVRIRFAVFAICLLFAYLAAGQGTPHPITNTDVISMTKAGLSEQTIILAIKRGPVQFDTSPQALIALKHAGVPDRVLNAILAAHGETNSKAKSSQFQPSLQSVQQSSPEQIAHQTIPTSEPRNVCAPQPGETSVASTVRTSCCEKGFGSSCSNLAHFYETGTQGLPKDISTANDLKKRACEDGVWEDCSYKIADHSEQIAFERAVALIDPTAEAASLETFLQVYPQSVMKQDVLEILAKTKRQAAMNSSPPQAPSSGTSERPPPPRLRPKVSR